MKNHFKVVVLFFVGFFTFFTLWSSVVAESLVVNFIIRDGDSVFWAGSVVLPSPGNINIEDSVGESHLVDARSVLGILYSEDISNDSFSLSNLQYFDSFSSFYVKCISDSGGNEQCDNWQYAVNTTTPFSSIDNTLLVGGETVGVYFGSQHRISLDKSEVLAGESLSVTTESYNYTDNTWDPLSGVSVGVTLPNPDNPWSPIVVSTNMVDGLGVAQIIVSDPDTYTLGIVEDFYFPSYTLEVLPLSTEDDTGFVYKPPLFNISNAVAFLKNIHEIYKSDIPSDIYTDWAVIAYSAAGVLSDTNTLIFSNLKNYDTPSSILTDNERRTMVLLSLGENPYSFSGVNYVESIVDTFDGVQFGDASLVNDDIFALIPLSSVGYTSDDDLIMKDISFILSKQNKSNGSWEDSVDLTAAAIQALVPFSSVFGVDSSISRASVYLQNMQRENGGWDSVYSTSWVMQAMNSLNVLWSKKGMTPVDYLNLSQDPDGAVLPSDASIEKRMWATSYIIPAALGKPWSAIFSQFSKKDNPAFSSGGVSGDISQEQAGLPEVKNLVQNVVNKASPPSVGVVSNDSKITDTLLSGVDISTTSTANINTADSSSFIFRAFTFVGSVIRNVIQSGIHLLSL